MSVTSGLGSFNKDKVANKFGIQLKKKDTNQQQEQLNSSSETKIFVTETTSLTKTKTMSDLRVPNKSNGFQSNTLDPNQKTLENSIKSKSNNELMSTSMHNERRDSKNSNVNHSTISNPVKTNQTSDTLKRFSLTSNDQTKSYEESSIKRTSISTTTTTNKTEAQIEYQKDQPLYKRQLSKTLDNTTSITSKNPTQSNSR